jgi:hypothetical protein
MAVRGDGFTIAGATEHNASLALAGRDRCRRRMHEVRIVDRFSRRRSEIQNIVAASSKMPHKERLVSKSGVIGGDGYSHVQSAPIPAT